MSNPVNKLIGTTAYEARLSLVILENLIKRVPSLQVFSEQELEEMRKIAIEEVKKLHPEANLS